MPPLSDNLRNEYILLFNTCNILPSRASSVENIIKRILVNKDRYLQVGEPLRIPWYFIAVIHNMESSLFFNGHFHNGDPLTARTKQVPKGRPLQGNPPFTWEESADDALKYQKLDKWNDWSVAGLLYKLEEYNGWGYRAKHPHVLSPYLWSFSNHYSKGKYVADGRWSETAASQQCGAAVLLRRMAEKGDIQLNKVVVNVLSSTEAQLKSKPDKRSKPIIIYSNKKIAYAKELQAYLNQIPGIFLKEDGAPGEKTSAAFKKVFGFYLTGDPRKGD